MSEVQSRPHRGRTSARGGRGGPRGGARASTRHVNGDSKPAAEVDTTANEGELGDLKKQYRNELSMLKEMFPGWTDADLLLALEDSRGDVTSTIDHITSGAVSQFAEVHKKTKDKTKPKEGVPGAPDTSVSTSRPPRGRGGADAGRGTSRGRPDRGRGGSRGGVRSAPQSGANGSRSTSAAVSVPTAESPAWNTIGETGDESTIAGAKANNSAPVGQHASVIASDVTPNTASEGTKGSLVPESGAKKTWASMFAPKPVPKAKPPQVKALERQQPSAADAAAPIESSPDGVPAVELPVDEPTPALPPSKDELTEENIEHLPDFSNNAPATETAASQVGSAHDIGGSVPGSATASVAGQPVGTARPIMGGYATSATKAMAGTGRSASFQRRVQEQQESLVMPGQHATDRVGVQFGMMGLNGDALEVDDERENAETRPQAPPLSPPSQPRASLPPVPRQTAAAESTSEAIPTPKQAPGLPPVPQQLSQQQQPSPNPIGAQIVSQQGSQGAPGYSRYGGLGQPTAQAEAATPASQRYDPFGQQAGQNPLEAYSSQQGQQGQSNLGGQTSGPGDYSSYYGSEQQRNTYQNYYGGGFGQQHASQQDAGAAQQRTGSAFGSAPGDSGYSAQSQQGANQGRYGETQGSGNNTPNPQVAGGNQHQSQQGQQVHQQHHGQGQQGAYPGYGGQAHPYYNSPYYQAYMNQYNYGSQGYGGPYGGGSQGGRYGQSHQGFGIPPQQASYGEHSGSPANSGSYGQSNVGRDSGLGSSASGLGEYGRSGSTQPSQTQSSSASGFGGLGGEFGRGQGGYGGSQGYGQQGAQQSSEDSLKPYGDSKAGGGPSPGLGQPGRPGSATNTTVSQGQSGLPAPQSQQQGFGGYPSQYGGQGSQYGSGLGGLGGHQGGQNHQGGFGGYGGGYGNYGTYGRGGSGWGNNYGGH